MKKLLLILLAATVALFLFVTGTPHHTVFAQCGGPAGGPCPTEPERERNTATPIPPTWTFTPTLTNTVTSTPTIIATATDLPDTATPTQTPTATVTPSPTPPTISQSVLPGAGIGALLLFLIIGLLLPAIQKIRVAKRGY
ncbi:MAG: hypothetical protein FJ031_00950 [Chloroflexi bacterium]|nr:hypothetical protein [Chloroflexota bacterium]